MVNVQVDSLSQKNVARAKRKLSRLVGIKAVTYEEFITQARNLMEPYNGSHVRRSG